ncbi:MAG: alpha/beta hydrolase [Bacteroidetes bacterium]|nr:alpha/beta hydrolase [Bacteroidota bacterium]
MFTSYTHSGFSFYDNQLPGQAIVFVHGLGANAMFADFLLRAFPKRRLLLCELPGHGQAPEPSLPVDISVLALQLARVLEEKGIFKPIMCGHSLGGQICLLAEVVRPGLADRLWLISPAGLESFSPSEIQMISSGWQMSGLFHPYVAPKYQSTLLNEPMRLPTPTVLKQYVESMMTRPVIDLLQHIHCDAQVYFGELDLLIPNRLFRPEASIPFARRTLKNWPHFHVFGIPGAGHWPMLENAKALVQNLQDHNRDI